MAARFKFGLREYPLPGSYSFGEARTIKRLTGMTLAEVDRQFATDGTDPDCLFALLLVSIQRVDPTITQEQIEALMMDDVVLHVDPPETSGGPPTDGVEDAPTEPQ